MCLNYVQQIRLHSYSKQTQCSLGILYRFIVLIFIFFYSTKVIGVFNVFVYFEVFVYGLHYNEVFFVESKTFYNILGQIF